MFKQRIKRTAFFGMILMFSASIFAQQNESVGTNKSEKSEHQILVIASTSGTPPDAIINLDNNFQILESCVSGKTIQQLQNEDLFQTFSQIQLLVNWELLLQANTVFTTAFPILDRQKTGFARELLKTNASIIG